MKNNERKVKCDGCGSEKESKTMGIKNRGYLSIFDGDVFEIHLCETCMKELDVKEEWFCNEACFVCEGEKAEDFLSANYRHEDQISDLIERLTPEAQERIETCENVLGLLNQSLDAKGRE